MPGLSPDLRALVAAAALALVTGRRVAGLFDHDTGRHRRLAAEHRAGRLQALDGDRGVRLDGALPELAADDGARFTLAQGRAGLHGVDRGSATAFQLVIAEATAQLFDHGTGAWTAYTAQLLPPDG